MIDGDGCFYYKEKMSNQFYLTGTIEQDWSSFITIFESIDVRVKHIKIQNKNKSSFIRVTNVKDIKKIGDFIYSTIEEDSIGLKRKYEKYKLIIKRLLDKDKNIEYIKESKDKSKKELSIELGISLFKINNILRNSNIIISIS